MSSFRQRFQLDESESRGPKRKYREPKLVARANSEVSIFQVLKDVFGIHQPDSGTRSYKGYCPFGFEHADGGLDKGFRTYPATNSAYCFPMHGYLTNTRLIQIAQDVSAYKAAQWLLERYGLDSGATWQERWSKLPVDRHDESRITTSGLVEALLHRLAAHRCFEQGQYAGQFTAALEAELEQLGTHAGPDEVRAWYAGALARLERVLEGLC